MEVPEKIGKLERIAERTAYEMQQDKARRDPSEKRRKHIDKEPPMKKLRFWCRDCRLDFPGIGRKYVTGTHDWPSAVYRSRCPDCGRYCLRHLTDVADDPYYLASHRVKRERGRHTLDLLQPTEHGFDTMYPDAMRQHISEMQEKEREIELKHFDPALRFGRSRAMREELRTADYRFNL